MTMGREYKDDLTGFKGALVGHGDFMEGGYQALLQPKVGSDGHGGDGKMPDRQYIPVNRLSFVD
jgi:hypothetical protein